MADTNLFSRLRRLFSTDVIIRNEGGNQLKVFDVIKFNNLEILKLILS
jgi:ribosomal protein L4